MLRRRSSPTTRAMCARDLIEAAAKGTVTGGRALQALSLRRVAREVGVAPSAVYNHFARTAKRMLGGGGCRRLHRQLAALRWRSSATRTLARNPPPCHAARSARDYLHFAAANPGPVPAGVQPRDGECTAPNPNWTRPPRFSSFGLSVDWWYGEGTHDPGAARHPLPLCAGRPGRSCTALAMQMIRRPDHASNTADPASIDRARRHGALGIFSWPGLQKGLPKNT